MRLKDGKVLKSFLPFTFTAEDPDYNVLVNYTGTSC